MRIGNFELGKNKVFIIAELSANHGGDINNAIKTIKAAKDIGADAIKLQTYTPDTITLNSNKDDFLIKGTIWNGKNMYDLYKEAYTPWEWHKKLFEVANEIGIICFSSPFDNSAVDLLEDLNAPAYKIASMEITDIPLIEYAASKGKPMIMSTGVANLEDIQLAIDTCKSVGNDNIALLKTSSQYPAKIEDANLCMIPEYEKKFNVFAGLSDHTMGEQVPMVATALGAKIIEKHFILDKSIGGPDASFSLDKIEFKRMIDAVRNVEKSIGKVNYDLTEKAMESRVFSRSLYVVNNMLNGEVISEKNVKSIRPGYGLHPKYLKDIIGKKVNQDLEKGTRFSLDFVK